MKCTLTADIIGLVLRLDDDYNGVYNKEFLNIEISNIETKKIVRLINVHAFVYTHCRDFIVSYTEKFREVSEIRRDRNNIPILHFDLLIEAPNLNDGSNVMHKETFSGVSELKVYADAVEWLIKYRADNEKLSKFWERQY